MEEAAGRVLFWVALGGPRQEGRQEEQKGRWEVSRREEEKMMMGEQG